MQYIYKLEAFAQNKESANYAFSGLYTSEQESVNIFKAILERARQSPDCVSFQGQVVKLTRTDSEDHGFTCTKFVKQPGAIIESEMINFAIDTKALTAQRSLGNKSKVVEQGLKNTVANNTKGVSAKVISTPVHQPPKKEEPAQKPRSFDF